MERFNRWAVMVLVAFVLHFGWEMAQEKWFAGMASLPLWQAALLCLRASMGDISITAIAFGVAALAARAVRWPLGPRVFLPFLTFLAVGIAITIGFEIFALNTGRWIYAAEMPTVFGIGILPLAQWTFIPPVEVVLFRFIWRTRTRPCLAPASRRAPR